MTPSQEHNERIARPSLERWMAERRRRALATAIHELRRSRLCVHCFPAVIS